MYITETESMKNILLSFTLSGIKNLDEDIILKFYQSKITKDISLINRNIKGIYGENGSGKTAIVSAMDIFQSLSIDNHYLMDSKNRIILDELMNKKSDRMHFKVEFLSISDSVKDVFCYEVCIKRNNAEYIVTYESLKRRSPSSSVYRNIYVIENGNFTDLSCSLNDSEILIERTKNLLLKATYVSMYLDLADQMSDTFFTHCVSSVLCFFLNIVVYLEKSDMHHRFIITSCLKKISYQTNIENSTLSQWLSIIQYSDFYLDRVKKSDYSNYLKMISGMTRFIQIFKNDLLKITVDTKEDGDFYRCNLTFVYRDYSIDAEFESTGIKKLIQLYQVFYKLNNGAIVFIDELDANLHDVYLCRLLEYIGEYAKGQLCFTSHNIGPMELLSRQKYGLDFITRNKEIVSWTKNGNYSAVKQYRAGMVKDLPFNIEAFDFLTVFGDENE